MAVPLRMPDLGTVEGEVTLVRWLKSEGETIALGEPLFEVETDKGVSEVEAAMPGVLEKRVAVEGTRVASGETIAYVRRHGETAGIPGAPGTPAPENTDSPSSSRSARPVSEPAAPPGSSESSGANRIAPTLRSLAAKWDIDLGSISGTGPGGRLTRDDVLRARDTRPPTGVGPGQDAAQAAHARRSLSLPQSVVARKVSESHREKPVYRVQALVDMSRVIAARHVDASDAAAGGKAASFDAFIVKASGMAIAEFPVFRRSLRGEQVVDHGVIDIAVALGVGEELYAPVVRGPGAKSVAEISGEIGSFKERAGSHSLGARDMEASCFLVSNLGMFPIEGFDAIIYPEHSAALAVAAVIRTPVAVGESVQIAPLARLTLSVDHRLINGATAARFLTRVKQILENGELA